MYIISLGNTAIAAWLNYPAESKSEMKKERLYMTVLTVLAVGVLCFASGGIEGMCSSLPAVNELKEVDTFPASTRSPQRKVWDGCLPGQASGPVNSDFVMGVVQVARPQKMKVWNAYVVSQASAPIKTDFVLLPAVIPGKGKSWDCNLSGSLSMWQQMTE
jgi:hypothetical protein